MSSAASSEAARKVMRGLVLAGGLYLGYRLTRRALEDRRARNTSVLADQSPAVRQAMSLRSAINPSGVSWLMWADGTNEAVVQQVASQIQNLEEVGRAYRNLYAADLLPDLQKELSTSLFDGFLQTVSSNRVNTASGQPFQATPQGAFTSPMKLIVAKKAVFVRTSPDASYHGAWYEAFEGEKNIFATAQPGEFIGYATGRQHFDAKNGVKFIEVTRSVVAGPLPAAWQAESGQTRVLWVSASANYTDQFADEASLVARYPQHMGVTSYVRPAPAGVGGWMAQHGQRVITQRPTHVMNQRFQRLGSVPSGTLLGYPVMELTGARPDQRWTLVRTVEGRDRWVSTDDITTP